LPACNDVATSGRANQKILNNPPNFIKNLGGQENSINKKYPKGYFLLYNERMETEQKKEEMKRFSVVARAKSFTHAFRGIGILIKSTHNFWIHIFFVIIVVFFGFTLRVSHIEWILLIFAMGFVMVSEAFNTAIEIDIDLTSPNYHPYARDTKDVAAGAVLISAITVIIIGLIIFLPKVIILI